MDSVSLSAAEFKEYCAEHYQEMASRFKTSIANAGLKFDCDIFHDTFLKIYQNIEKGKIRLYDDKTLLNYCYTAFRMNTIRERVYSRNSKRCDCEVQDLNVEDDSYMDINNIIKSYSGKIDKEFGKGSWNIFSEHTGGVSISQLKQEYPKVRNIRKVIVDITQRIKEMISCEVQ